MWISTLIFITSSLPIPWAADAGVRTRVNSPADTEFTGRSLLTGGLTAAASVLNRLVRCRKQHSKWHQSRPKSDHRRGRLCHRHGDCVRHNFR